MAVTEALVGKDHRQAGDLQGIVEALDSISYDLLASRLLGEMVDRGKEAEFVKESALLAQIFLVMQTPTMIPLGSSSMFLAFRSNHV